MTEVPELTTHGVARYHRDRDAIIIDFGVLRPGEDRYAVEPVALDVGAYAAPLARDLLIAIVEREAAHEEERYAS